MDSSPQKQHQQPNSPFDLIPDDVVHLILNKILDAKTLLRCLSLSKRFASLIPQTDVVSLPLFLPRSLPPQHNVNSVNILKSLANYLIPKPLRHLLRRNHRRRDSPSLYPPQLLRTFNRITRLHLQIHTYGGAVDAEFLKWNASYGAKLRSCVVLCATSLRRGAAAELEGEEPSGETAPLSVPNDEFKKRIVWTISCLISASARHFLMKQMVVQFPTLRTVEITDAKRQGMFSMKEGDIGELRDAVKRDGAPELSPEAVVPDLRMRMWYVPELELPAAGSVVKGATLVVIGPADGEGEIAPPEVEEDGGDGGFDGDVAEKAVFGEAVREILKKKKSSYVMEMTSF